MPKKREPAHVTTEELEALRQSSPRLRESRRLRIVDDHRPFQKLSLRAKYERLYYRKEARW